MSTYKDHFKSAAVGIGTALAPAICLTYSIVGGNNAYFAGSGGEQTLAMAAGITGLSAIMTAFAIGTSDWGTKRLTQAVTTLATAGVLGTAAYANGVFDERTLILPEDMKIEEPQKAPPDHWTVPMSYGLSL